MTNEPCTVRAEHGDCGAHPMSAWLCRHGKYADEHWCDDHEDHKRMSTVPTTEPNPWADEDVAAVDRALAENGATQGASIHGWRCDYPDRYGPCTCVADTRDDILAALAPRLVERERAAAAKALRDAAYDYGQDRPRTSAAYWLGERAGEIERGER